MGPPQPRTHRSTTKRYRSIRVGADKLRMSFEMELSLQQVAQLWVYFAHGGAAPMLRERSFLEGSMTSRPPHPVDEAAPLTLSAPGAHRALHTPLSANRPHCRAGATLAARQVRNLLPSPASDSVCNSHVRAGSRRAPRVNLGPGAALACPNVQHSVRTERKPDQQLTPALSPVCDSEPNEESQGDLSCRRNQRTSQSSVRPLYEPRSGGRTW